MSYKEGYNSEQNDQQHHNSTTVVSLKEMIEHQVLFSFSFDEKQGINIYEIASSFVFI